MSILTFIFTCYAAIGFGVILLCIDRTYKILRNKFQNMDSKDKQFLLIIGPIGWGFIIVLFLTMLASDYFSATDYFSEEEKDNGT